MMDVTTADMTSRFDALTATMKAKGLSLRECGERDAIKNHGFEGWTKWLKKKARKKAKLQ